MDGIPRHAARPALRAEVQRKAAAVGFDWASVAGALAQGRRGAGRAAGGRRRRRSPRSSATCCSRCVNVARHLGVDPEAALRAATAKFRDRFVAVEALAAARGLALPGAPLAELDGLWDEVKGTRRSVATVAGCSMTGPLLLSHQPQESQR